ncbi:MAG: protein kinase [Acidobacteriota bacterium]
MDADRFKKVDEIFDAVLDLQPDERAAYLGQVCGGDSDLRREVESLLEARNQIGNFIETPAAQAAAKSFAQQTGRSLIGRAIKHYNILALIGTGGMGEVYLAEDTRLHRKVALKILPPQSTRDPDRVARFQRESRAASALNHPNIITIHEIGQEGDLYFIVTEFIEGDTLRKKIARGKLALKEAIDITLQAAAALDAAHRAGIVHRDIKPENIMIRHDGYVKVLDFGLAKLTEKSESDANLTGEIQLSTETGVVMGTVSYMSPEQAAGHSLDHRTDLFSLGVVFYEAVSGKNPFKRDLLATTLNAILEEQPPPISNSNAAVSLELERIITRLLEKDKELRYQTAADLRASFRRLQKNLDSRITASADKISATRPTISRKPVSEWWRNLAIALAGLSIFLLAGWLFFPRSGVKSNMPNWQNARVTKLTDQSGVEYFPSLSPDGKSIIYASDARGNFDIYLQRIGSKKTINLTEDSPGDDTQATFSPDGTRIAFRSERNGGGIFLMNETGESVKQLTNFGYNPSWSPDSKAIVCAEEAITIPSGREKIPSRLWVVSVATGESRILSEGDAVQPNWSPNGKRIAYGVTRQGIWTMRPDGSDAKPILTNNAGNSSDVWSPDGRYIYFNNARRGVPYIWRVAIDEASGETSGEPELIPTPASYVYQLTFSKDGKRLAFSQDHTIQNIYRLPFDPVTTRITGQPEPVTNNTDSSYMPVISPNGELLIFMKRFKLLALKTNSSTPHQLIEGTANEATPRWSPDGKRIAFQMAGQIYGVNADGSGLQQITKAPAPGVAYPVWSPDGKRLAYSVVSNKTYILDLSRPFDQQTPEPTPDFPNSNAYFIAWDWSPDGKYLVGNQGENGIDSRGIYIYSLANKTYEAISDINFSEIVGRPLWLNDSRHIMFSTREKILVADMQTKKLQEIYATGRNAIEVYSLTKDNRYIYASIAKPDADIWMLALE